jgi:hypothetical protein
MPTNVHDTPTSTLLAHLRGDEMPAWLLPRPANPQSDHLSALAYIELRLTAAIEDNNQLRAALISARKVLRGKDRDIRDLRALLLLGTPPAETANFNTDSTRAEILLGPERRTEMLHEIDRRLAHQSWDKFKPTIGDAAGSAAVPLPCNCDVCLWAATRGQQILPRKEHYANQIGISAVAAPVAISPTLANPQIPPEIPAESPAPTAKSLPNRVFNTGDGVWRGS